MALLAGDIGGTRSRLALYSCDSGQLLAQKSYPSQQFPGLGAVVQRFFHDTGAAAVDRACFGLPGPVRHDQAALTNLPWQLDAAQLQQQLGIGKIRFINDFQAAASGIDALQPDALLCLQQGQPDPDGNRLVVGAGTGLGVAPVINIAGRFMPQACEGGHMDFAPTSQLQQQILSWLWQVWPHVSYERLLSGAGLQYLYGFFAGLDLQQRACWPEPAQIQRQADAGQEHAVAALQAFVRIYGAYIGNAALIWPANAGIYIAGGIAGKIQSWMCNNDFLDSMQDKGRMRPLIQRMPVYLVCDPDLGLKGAMLCARNLAAGQAAQ